jgi:hypothetical protein
MCLWILKLPRRAAALSMAVNELRHTTFLPIEHTETAAYLAALMVTVAYGRSGGLALKNVGYA